MNATDRTRFLIKRDPDLTNLQSPILSEIYQFWLGLCVDSRLPSRADFSPLDLNARLLPYIAIADVVRKGDQLRFRWRLVGTHITEKMDRDVTGLYFEDIYAGDNHENLLAAYVWPAQNAKPLRWFGNSEFVEKHWLTFECVGMPLASDGKTVDKLLAGMFFS